MSRFLLSRSPLLALARERAAVRRYSPRTVDVYRARLMRKYGAATTPELVHKLLSA